MDKQIRTQLEEIGLKNLEEIKYQLRPEELIQDIILFKQGEITDSGAIACDTGEFTGRSPRDKYIVDDFIGKDAVSWGDINRVIPMNNYKNVLSKMQDYLQRKSVYVRDVFAGQDEHFKLNIRVITENPWQNLFSHNMFGKITDAEELKDFTPDWHIIAVPSYEFDLEINCPKNKNFTIINFAKKLILIGGSGYTGEIKKGIFSVLNYILPNEHNILSMHCSANKDENGETAIFFGLSGTGKTTLSADESRQLIGDDEHGWDDNGVFNFEGGCYAKCINLSKEGEPQIYNAIKFGSLLENVKFYPGTRTVDFSNTEITENTRVSYPIDYISNYAKPSVGNHPKHIFFLTCDAFGVMPPIAKLSKEQAMYYFLSGYTSKVAGTEVGITDPETTFSACFGEPFLPLHPVKYAQLLGEKIEKHDAQVWMVNTGWTGGGFGVGSRIKLAYTRSIINAVLNNQLENCDFIQEEIFGLSIPSQIEGVPENLLFPENTWDNKEDYSEKAHNLAAQFKHNFEGYSDLSDPTIKQGEPIQSDPKMA